VNILYEDNHLLFVCKPAGLPTMGVAEGRTSLLEEAKAYLKQNYGKPGNVYLGIVSRLDAPVTGVIVLARTSKAAARLAEQFRKGEVTKVYWALVEGHPDPDATECTDLIRKDERRQRMYVTRQSHTDAQTARLSYRTLDRFPHATLLEVRLDTGRKHQIRVQLAHRGHPILGDRKYGSITAFPAGIALHARQLSLLHPVRRTPLAIEAPPPECWQQFKVKER
jgi:23S rRNA pseudouridine1911/1915/1917 synthase